MAYKRSKHATDIMYRLWDEHVSRWAVGSHGRSIWVRESTAVNLRNKMIAKGRTPETLSVESVWIECK